MYATCTFCHRTLGRNEALEYFPVGRRLAYDAAKGRLWVVCTACQQWNLSPLEERWEAIEGAERLFRGAKLRQSTDNIGLTRLPDGTDLIRVGKPLRPEFAAWRYGENFLRRRRGTLAGVGVATALVAGTAWLLPAPGFLAGITAGSVAMAGLALQISRLSPGKIGIKGRYFQDNEQQYVHVTTKELANVFLQPHSTGWALKVPYNARRPTLEGRWADFIDLGSTRTVIISGQPAVAAARQLLPVINGYGANKRVVGDAVALAGEWGNTSAGFVYSLAHTREWSAKLLFGDTGSLSSLPAPVRLALEMALHEDEEKRALEGELAELERTWKEAEEIAAISDDLLVPGAIDRALNKLRGRN